MLAMLLTIALAQFPESTCVTTNGTGACGYDCKTTNGKAACAATPLGKCVTTDGKIFCADPPPFVMRLGLDAQMQCATTNGTGACGYDCKTTNGKAACATTPFGKCVTTNGKIFCADPPGSVLRYGVPEQMRCVTTNGTAACGYSCVTANGAARCSMVPWGACTRTNGQIFCSDGAQPSPANCVNGTCEY